MKKRKKKKKKSAPGLSRQRAEVIMKVRCGLMTATDAARELGVSRKTYYKWEERGLASLLEGVQDHPPGRPEDESGPDPREEDLARRIAELEREKELLRHQMDLKDMLHEIEIEKQDKKKRQNKGNG